MDSKCGKVIHLHRRAPEAALEALNRLTGLRFSHWPDSLVERPPEGGCAMEDRPTARVEQAVG